jgi:hypothetical protein
VDKFEAELPTDLLASLLMEQASASSPTSRKADRLPPMIFAVMALTVVLTFGTLVTGYQLLFSHQLFA